MSYILIVNNLLDKLQIEQSYDRTMMHSYAPGKTQRKCFAVTSDFFVSRIKMNNFWTRKRKIRPMYVYLFYTYCGDQDPLKQNGQPIIYI